MEGQVFQNPVCSAFLHLFCITFAYLVSVCVHARVCVCAASGEDWILWHAVMRKKRECLGEADTFAAQLGAKFHAVCWFLP